MLVYSILIQPSLGKGMYTQYIFNYNIQKKKRGTSEEQLFDVSGEEARFGSLPTDHEPNSHQKYISVLCP